MSYLLQNRRRLYETALPRIPDQRVRNVLWEINQLSEPNIQAESDPIFLSKHLLLLELEDAYKKPLFGEKLGRVVISASEFIGHAIRMEELCFLAYSGIDSDRGRQIADSSALRLRSLREYLDGLRYHKIRLID